MGAVAEIKGVCVCAPPSFCKNRIQVPCRVSCCLGFISVFGGIEREIYIYIYIYGPILGVALATICKVPPASSKLVFQPLNHVYTYLDLQTPKKVDPFGC